MATGNYNNKYLLLKNKIDDLILAKNTGVTKIMVVYVVHIQKFVRLCLKKILRFYQTII